MDINAEGLSYKDLNNIIRNSPYDNIDIKNVIGQRYIGTGIKNKEITIQGIPGNALGACLDKCNIFVYGNGQDAIGDTMNSGKIVLYGKCGDAAGYSMRGGEIYIREDAGYRIGIHMKEYEDQKPTIVVGGKVGEFLGEYQAGGRIIVLGLNYEDEWPIGEFMGTGMHGGNIYVRSTMKPKNLSKYLICEELEDINEISGELMKYVSYFDNKIKEKLFNSKYYKISPHSYNQYHQLYIAN